MQEIHFVRQKIKGWGSQRFDHQSQPVDKAIIIVIKSIMTVRIKIAIKSIILIKRNGCLIAMPSPNLRALPGREPNLSLIPEKPNCCCSCNSTHP